MSRCAGPGICCYYLYSFFYHSVVLGVSGSFRLGCVLAGVSDANMFWNVQIKKKIIKRKFGTVWGTVHEVPLLHPQ